MVIGRTWSWKKKGQYYLKRRMPYSVQAAKCKTLDSKSINDFFNNIRVFDDCGGVVAVEAVMYTKEECDYWVCKILGHRYGKEYDVHELNKTGAYTAKRKCRRCGQIFHVNGIRAGGSITTIPSLCGIIVEDE